MDSYGCYSVTNVGNTIVGWEEEGSTTTVGYCHQYPSGGAIIPPELSTDS